MSARELPVDLALGAIEAMDVLSNSNEAAAVPYWYKLLNTGLRCAISGGSDSFTNRRHHWLPGGQRVYVHTGGELDYRRWIDGYRRGRSFATNGPLLQFTVNGELPGTDFELRSGEEFAGRSLSRIARRTRRVRNRRERECRRLGDGPFEKADGCARTEARRRLVDRGPRPGAVRSATG